MSASFSGTTVEELVAFVGMANKWGLRYSRHELILSEDTYMEYSILHVGPFEFFTRARAVALDFF